MSAGPTPAERISALEEHSRLHGEEIARLRDKAHRHGGQLQSLLNWEFDRRVQALERFQHRTVGMALGLGTAAGIIGGLIVRLLPT